MCDLKIPPSILQLIFPLSQVSFEAHKFLILMESNLSDFLLFLMLLVSRARTVTKFKVMGIYPCAFL